jgi:hypothetical protein
MNLGSLEDVVPSSAQNPDARPNPLRLFPQIESIVPSREARGTVYAFILDFPAGQPQRGNDSHPSIHSP